MLVVEDLRDVVDARRIRAGHHALAVDVTHQRNLVLEGVGDIAVASQNDGIGNQTNRAKFSHRVLGRLGLQFLGGAEVRNQ